MDKRRLLKRRLQRLYPIGEQDFPTIRKTDRLYIDKTALVYRMTHSSAKYMFLSRPRRFGKSLLVSTLKAYFEGRGELFQGLAIDAMESEWESYPVILLDISLAKHEEADSLNRYLLHIVKLNEESLGIPGAGEDPNLRLSDLIMRANKTTGRQVVVLIDEYDSPLLDVMHEEENLPKLRKVMRNFYSPLKAASPYLRYVFLTGITKFSQLSIFSELNNIENISMDSQYATLCGISKEEMLTQMSEDIDLFAEKLGITHEEMVSKLIENYDGYHFTWPSPDVFNPFSLLMAMEKGKIDSYWFGSGTPTYLIETMRKFGTLPSAIGGIEAPDTVFDAPAERLTDITPLLYQSGYTTIKAYDDVTQLYTLDIPNKEIRKGLMESLMPSYVNCSLLDGKTTIGKMYRCLAKGDMEGCLEVLRAFLLTVPYTDNTAYEGHWQQVLYIIFSLLNCYVDVEVHTATGRVDLVMRTKDTLYLVETKLGKTAEAAAKQIDLKDYASRFASCGLPVVKVGINFDAQQHTITDWTIKHS